MNEDVLRVQHGTLYEIICSRYKELSPRTIEKRLEEIEDAEFRIEFITKSGKNKAGKSDEQKRISYIHAEVSRALKLLSKQPILDEYEAMEFDIDELENKKLSKLEKEDYSKYPHTLVIGIKAILKDEKIGVKNSGYRLNRNIKFSQKFQNEDLLIATKYLYMLYTSGSKHIINSDMVTYITAYRNNPKKQNNKYLTLLTNTFVQLELHDIIVKNEYSLDILLGLISINAEINMTIQNKNSIFELKNVKINELIFDKNKFQIVCNEAILTIDDIKDIQLIESSSKNNIITNIEQIQGILLEYSENVQEYFNTKIKDLKTLNELFFIS